MPSETRSPQTAGRFVVDARYVEPKPSGIGRYVEALIERLPGLAPEQTFELWTHPARPAPVSFPNVRCQPVSAPSDGLRTLLTPQWLGHLGTADVIHFPFSLLGRGLRCATVVTVHDLMWLEQPELVEGRPLMRRVRQPYYRQGMRWALRFATRLIAVSEATRTRMVAQLPECADRVRVTHNAADARFRPAADSALAAQQAAAVLGTSAPYYLVVGKNEPYKAHELALTAFAANAQDDEILVLIQRASGGRGLLELGQRLGIATRLRFLPALSSSELLSLLQAARALIQPSIVEGFGIPVLEAMACGCPVIASATPALLEVTGGAGLHAAVGDADALGAALTRLRAPGVAAELRERGLTRARSFSWERTANETLAVYREAAAEHARSVAGGCCVIDVVVDMSALNTCSRERGIGRYVRSLCLALSTRDSWLAKYPELGGRELSIAGLVRHRGRSEGALDPTLLFAGDYGIVTSGLRDQRHKLERRLFLGGLLRRVSTRLAHLPDPPGTPIDRRQRRIVTCHDLIPLVLAKDYLSKLPGSRLLQRARDRARYKSATRVIAISEATRRDLIEQLGILPERIDVVHHGVDQLRFNPHAEPGELAELQRALQISGPYLLYLGAGDVRKNLPLLVRAYARSGVAKDVSLLLAGPLSQRARARLKNEATLAGVADRVQLLGYTEEKYVAPLYRHCLAHVFPSSYEGFGLTVLEAMASGAPTLTTAFSSLGEVAGDAALTLSELEVEPFARELERLVSDAKLRAELTRRGLAHAQRFTWERCAAQTLGCYQRALDTEPA